MGMLFRLPADLSRVALLLSASFLAGVLNGLLGTGGGMVLLFTLSTLLGRERGREAFVLSSVGVLVYSLFSLSFYGPGGGLDYALLPRYALPAVGGGLAGALLLDRVSTRSLRRLFGALLLYSGLKMTGVLG